MITTLILIFVPCLCIYLAFEFNLGGRLLDALERNMLNLSRKAERPSRGGDRMPGMGVFLFSWLLPFLLIMGYKHWFAESDLEGTSVVLYGLILAFAAAVGLFISRIQHKKMIKNRRRTLNGSAENANVLSTNASQKR
jgi:hypothetical protein